MWLRIIKFLAILEKVRIHICHGIAYLLFISNKFIDKDKFEEIWKREALSYFDNEKDDGVSFLMN